MDSSLSVLSLEAQPYVPRGFKSTEQRWQQLENRRQHMLSKTKAAVSEHALLKAIYILASTYVFLHSPCVQYTAFLNLLCVCVWMYIWFHRNAALMNKLSGNQSAGARHMSCHLPILHYQRYLPKKEASARILRWFILPVVWTCCRKHQRKIFL